MAINYTNLFTALGKIIKAANYYASTFSTIQSNRDTIFDQLAGLNADYIGANFSGASDAHLQAISGGITTYQDLARALLTDQTLVKDNLPVASNSQFSEIMSALCRDMVTNSQTVNAGYSTVGSITGPATSNLGKVLACPLLDGLNPPTIGGLRIPAYADSQRLSELGVVDSVYLRCLDGTVEGQEQLMLFGNNAVAPFQPMTESVGGSVTINPSDALNNFLSNSGFETYSGGAFTDWTKTGTGTLAQETSNFFRGASALKVLTPSSGDDFDLKQQVTGLDRNRLYLAGVWVRSVAAESGVSISPNIELQDENGSNINDTAVTCAGLGTVSLASTTWRLFAAGIVINSNANYEETHLNFNFPFTDGGIDGVILDSAFLIPATYFNGIGYGFANGAGRLQNNDLFTIPMTRTGGVIQEFVRKSFGFQFPSNNAGGETQADSLAT